MLTLVYLLNFLDRGLIGLLLQPIKLDLNLSDTQLGFLTGIAFALFYATLGVPIARWADRGDRVTITSVAIGLWGLTVMACFFVANFTHLVLARIAAAVGESGCMPPTYSLVGDYFPLPAERTRAMSIYWLAAPFSALVSFIAGGWLNDLYGWRMTFFLMGLPALLVAVLIRTTIVEPRTRTRVPGISAPAAPPMSAVLGALWHRHSTRHLTIGLILLLTMGFGMAPWYGAFMIRIHGMGTAALGLWLGLVFGLGGIAGILGGGLVTTRWLARDERAQLRMCAVALVAVVPCFVLFLLLPRKEYALAALFPLITFLNFFLAPIFALLQRLATDDMRATTLAVVMLLANLIGMGLGPQAVGMLSDLLAPRLGNESLRYAMLAMSCLTLFAAYHFWRAGRTVRDDLLTVACAA
jgi:MFS family permease